MNTNKLYSPSYVQSQCFKEAEQLGLTRMEVSYYAESSEISNKFYLHDFVEDGECDLFFFELCVNEV